MIHQKEASSGAVKNNLDLEIQRVIESALSDVEEAAVILDAKNGDILDMASSPKYDPTHMHWNMAPYNVNPLDIAAAFNGREVHCWNEEGHGFFFLKTIFL